MENYVGEIKVFPYGFVPNGWLACDGRSLLVQQYHMLFAVIGNTYGGDGRSTFSLPDLQGRAPMGSGNGPGLTPRRQGEAGGAASVALSPLNIPPHGHVLNAVQTGGADSNDPTGRALAVAAGLYGPAENLVANQACIATSGSAGNQPHNNMQPYLALTYCIAYEGTFPVRS